MPTDFNPTLTHARLRAAQGDVGGARAILERLLATEPGNAQARRMLGELVGRRDRGAGEEASSPVPRPRSAHNSAGNIKTTISNVFITCPSNNKLNSKLGHRRLM